ncbi:MAG: hypothetical protein P0S95_02100 [Rhabdochlamydiaceae bacterium]|nr:hypothetical protein [Candidatus Amphrikana amoebophyrae]
MAFDPGPMRSGLGGDYGVSQIQAEQAKVFSEKNRLDKATDPFHAFYYMVAEHMDVRDLKTMESKINVLAGDLDTMQQFVGLAEKIRQDFDAGKPGSAPVIRNGVPIDPDKQIRIDVAQLLNGLVGKNVFPADGSQLTYNQFETALGFVGGSSQTKVFGDATVKQVINSIMKGFGITSSNNDLFYGATTLKAIWQKTESGTPTEPGQPPLPDPTYVQPFLDQISVVAGVMKGMSGAETSKLNYSEKRYFMVVSYLKSMFGYYFKELKIPVSKTQSAGN